MSINAPRSDQRDDLRALWQEAFGDSDAFLDTFEKTAFSSERCRCVTEEGGVVAALYWFDCIYQGSPVAYLYAIATAKSYRGKGLCRALMEDTHKHLEERGYAAALLVPSEDALFAFYEKLGYKVCSSIGEIQCLAKPVPISVREISLREYTAIRRQLLPENGVLQENENIRFLQAQAALYAGDGFLLAAKKNGDTLYGVELLGDVTVAQAVTGALGCIHGRFRVVGGNRPFAMYYPLSKENIAPPIYFGLAFD